MLAGLALFGVAAVVNVRRSPVRSAEPRWPRWRSVALIGVGVALNLALAERAGFVIASAVLFWFVARAFDERPRRATRRLPSPCRSSAYLLFARVLQLSLPAGVLSGWL